MNPEMITYLGDPKFPRGLRNNNPGNIRRAKFNWTGKITWSVSKDKEFEQFHKLWYGVRALIKLLLTYFVKHKLNTVSQIINRWAPDTENNTEAYIASVCVLTGFKKNQVLIPNTDTLKKLVYAITDHENGYKNAIPEAVFDYAIKNI